MEKLAGLRKSIKNLSPSQILLAGFALLILSGAALLTLPAASADSISIGFVDALFTSASAVCVTGLSVFDPGSALSLFGQVTLLTLIQLGGLGIMIMTSMAYMMMRRRISLKSRMLLKDSLNESRYSGVVRLARNAVIVTAAAELTGVALLAVRFIPIYGAKGLFYSIFHSVSSFCNAGFDVFGMGNNLVPFEGDLLVNIVTCLLIIGGGLGFFVIVDLAQKVKSGKKHRLSYHTKAVLICTGVLLLAGFIIFLLAESQNSATLKNASTEDKILGALFQSVTSRTAGFSTIQQYELAPVSKVTTVFLMFVGASPAGTAGGIKTTTTLVLISFIVSVLKGRDDVVFARRRINRHVVMRAIATFTIGIVFVLAMSGVIAVVEYGNSNFREIIFEVTSAFSTTGLSLGVTSALDAASKLLLVVAMLSGRVGVLTFTMALAKRMADNKTNIRYPEDKIIIG